MQFLNFIVISISLFWTLGLTQPAHESKVVRRNFGPDHKGYQCGKKKYIIFDIDVAVKNACRAYSHQRSQRPFGAFLGMIRILEIEDSEQGADVATSPTGLNVVSYNYVIFMPADCKFVKVVHKSHKKKHEKHENYDICKYVVWPSRWTDIFKTIEEIDS
ncbi:unnamed protein product [Blumeria hordei]|uniref:Uncharacterized protein n=1 Tax=Blumeria hordei TaxID=2867405 RepID=A0A383UKH3_BLUHO|nr:unnamed protein product [Blumeria hordei]